MNRVSDSTGPLLTIDFTSQGGGLYVRDYPSRIDPDLAPQWPGYPVTLEPRPYLRSEPSKIRKQMLRDWHQRLKLERASQAAGRRAATRAVCRMRFERSQTIGALASAAMLAALAIALMPGRPMAVVIALAALGAVAVAVVAAPGAVQLVVRRHSMVLVFVLAALILAWFVAGRLARRAELGHSARSAAVRPVSRTRCSGTTTTSRELMAVAHRPAAVDLARARMLLCAAGGFVLNADAVRVQLGYAQPRRSSWRLLTSNPTRGGRIAIRAIPGVALVAVAAGHRHHSDEPLRLLQPPERSALRDGRHRADIGAADRRPGRDRPEPASRLSTRKDARARRSGNGLPRICTTRCCRRSR